LLLFLPLAGVGLLSFINGRASQVLQNSRAVALWTTIVVFLVFLTIWSEFDTDKSTFQLMHHIPVFGGLGIDYVIGVDGVSLLMLMLTTGLMPLVVLAGWSSIKTRPKEYYIALLSMETFLIGAFVSLNVLMFYVFFEAILIPMFLLIGIWGGERRIYATFKFFIYTFAGSILVLVAFLVMGSYAGSFNIIGWGFPIEEALFANVAQALWWGLFIGFAIKIPMVPLHTWLPDAHVEAPATASMVLAGVLLKLGGYAMIRFHLLAFPALSSYYFPVVATLSVVAIVYASLLAWGQSDMKKLVAYSSVAHMGYVTIGIYSQSVLGLKGAVIQMLSHGVISAGLFYSVDMLYRRVHSRDISHYGGVVNLAPKMAVLVFIFILGLISLPATSGFVGEIMVMLAIFKLSPAWGMALVIGVILAPIYGLTFYRSVFLGKLQDTLPKLRDVTLKELCICGVLILMIGWIGLYPKPLIKALDATAHRMVSGR
jgi:NADH-quinone oxidoreductase subunit M